MFRTMIVCMIGTNILAGTYSVVWLFSPSGLFTHFLEKGSTFRLSGLLATPDRRT